jgi:hypothetical protein
MTPESNVYGGTLKYLEFNSIFEVNGYLHALQHVHTRAVRVKPPQPRRAKKPKRKT